MEGPHSLIVKRLQPVTGRRHTEPGALLWDCVDHPPREPALLGSPASQAGMQTLGQSP